MQALTVQPGTADSLRVTEVPDPEPGPDELLVDGLSLGVCGTDKEIASGQCRNGRYTERGIKEIDGYGSEQCCVATDYATKVNSRLNASVC